ncbi:MAG TPA: YihY/virulence factor BrkB family protein [Candidatus Limnocylindrales bacterium]|nr:YihY/virulence factor BrkB family protein [Candidatus Limnocylindrales bacterium]
MSLQRLLSTLPGRVLQKFLQDQAPNWAVLIAWNALFALFPIIVFIAAVLGLIAGLIGESKMVACQAIGQTSALDCTLLKALPQNLVPGAYDALHHFENQKGLLFVVGFVGLLWGGSALFGAMEQAFAVIYHTRPRDFLQQKVMSVAMIVLFTVLGGVAVATSFLLPALPAIPGAPPFLKSGFSLVLQVAVGLIAGSLLFTTIYYVVPNRPQRFHTVWAGGVIAGTLFELVTLLFPIYIELTNSVATYGKTFGLLFVILTFFSFLGLITMVGVEVNSVLYPVPVEQPARGSTITAAPRTAGDPVPRVVNGAAARNGQHGSGTSRGLQPRTVLGLAVVASLIGVLLGRRSAGGD